MSATSMYVRGFHSYPLLKNIYFFKPCYTTTFMRNTKPATFSPLQDTAFNNSVKRH